MDRAVTSCHLPLQTVGHETHPKVDRQPQHHAGVANHNSRSLEAPSTLRIDGVINLEHPCGTMSPKPKHKDTSLSGII